MNNLRQYTGWKRWAPSEQELCSFYQSGETPFEMTANEYLLIYNSEGEIVDKKCYQKGSFRSLKISSFDSGYSTKIKPRNIEQECAVDMLLDKKTTIKLMTGTQGTGKDLLCAVTALKEIEKGTFDKIVWIRNNIQVKDTENIGALPGDSLMKSLPWLGPFMDHAGGEYGVQILIEKEKLEVIPLAFVRGRSIRNAIVICSEAENLTKEHLQLLIGRIDEGSNLWINGDTHQRDKIVFERSQGLETLINCLQGEELFAYTHLITCERSATARLADKIK